MGEESRLVVGRRGRAEIARLAGLYRTSEMGRSEFCRIHGLALSTLGRHLKKQSKEQAGSNRVGPGRLVAVELAAKSAQA
jgi:DNA-binding transcriptional ArsR family regulator